MKKIFFLKKKKNYKFLTFIFFIFILIVYLFINFTVGKTYLNNVKNVFDKDQKDFIKKYFFPYKTISQLSRLTVPFHRMELDFKESLENILHITV